MASASASSVQEPKRSSVTALLRTRSFGTRLQAGAESAAAVAITSFAAGGTDFDTFVSESGRSRIARLAGTGPARRCRRLGAVKAVELVEHGAVEAFADRVVVRGADRSNDVSCKHVLRA
jgi:hypothetical protein